MNLIKNLLNLNPKTIHPPEGKPIAADLGPLTNATNGMEAVVRDVLPAADKALKDAHTLMQGTKSSSVRKLDDLRSDFELVSKSTQPDKRG